MAVGSGVYVSNLGEVRKYLRKIHPDLVPVLREDLKSAERDELIKNHGYKPMDYHE